ncbi:hypothetical protein Ciccas_010947 [Cichlidogyrus casuarinus]|uniref:RING finger protein 113A n=1 Tax=Cichlidogyrus casuarinus TaxID=1844966 RepID=A0ABD2PT33_9PLAT
MSEKTETCVFLKKRKRAAVRGNKITHSDPGSNEEEDLKIFKKSKEANRGLKQKVVFRSQTVSVLKNAAESSEEEEDTVKTYKASRSAEMSGPKDQGTTSTVEIHPEEISRVKKEKPDISKFGPLRAPTNLRATVRWDYQPDICKDYKETGFCSFGDSCKFLHDRGDYKFGWQIDQEIENGTYGMDTEDDRYVIRDANPEDDIPDECMICREEYKDPVMTSCKHYFCSDCALKRFFKTARCYACNEDTRGIFSNVPDLNERIRKRADERRQDHEEQHVHTGGCCGHEHEAESDEEEQVLPSVGISKKVEGAEPEALEDCRTSEEEDDAPSDDDSD